MKYRHYPSSEPEQWGIVTNCTFQNSLQIWTYVVCYARLHRCVLRPNKTFIWSWPWWANVWFVMNASVVASCDQIKLLFGPGPEWAWPNKTYIWSWQPLQFLPKSHLGRDLRTPLPAPEDAFAGTCSTSEPDQIKLIFGLGNHCNSLLNHTRTPMAAAKPM